MQDLFWMPAKGDLVLMKPGTDAAWFKSDADLQIPRRILSDVSYIEDCPMVWAIAIGPVKRRTLANGRVIEEGPNNQQPFRVEDLMPYEAPAETDQPAATVRKRAAQQPAAEAA